MKKRVKKGSNKQSNNILERSRKHLHLTHLAKSGLEKWRPEAIKVVVRAAAQIHSAEIISRAIRDIGPTNDEIEKAMIDSAVHRARQLVAAAIEAVR